MDQTVPGRGVMVKDPHLPRSGLQQVKVLALYRPEISDPSPNPIRDPTPTLWRSPNPNAKSDPGSDSCCNLTFRCN